MTSKLERFTHRARGALRRAQEEAERLRHAQIGPEHLLLGLVSVEGSVAGRVLRELGIEGQQVRDRIQGLTAPQPAGSQAQLDISAETKRVLEAAVQEARRHGHHHVGTEHLLLGLAQLKRGVAAEVLGSLGTSSEQIRRQVRRVLQESPSRAAPAPRPRPQVYALAFIGFGNVGRALARLLQSKSGELRERYGIEWRLTGVATRRMQWLARPEGLGVDLLLEASAGQAEHAALPNLSPAPANLHDWLAAARPDVVFELTSLNPETGQPAIDHIRAALEFGAHAITANKGPIVHAYRELRDLAHALGRRFLFEATVMDGAPVFSLFREALPAANLLRFRGILNSTTNFIFTEMEAGRSFDEAVRQAQAIGIAETDPSADVDGWDAAVKVAALATVLMDIPLKPEAVAREGIRALTPEAVRAARAAGRPYKLVCRAERTEGGVSGSVRPEQVPLADPLATVSGTSSLIHFETDTLPGLTLTEHNPGPETTAYGLLADFIQAVTK